jgi:hypothetical protein
LIVTLGGAILFLIFGVLYLYEGFTWQEITLQDVDPMEGLLENESRVGMGSPTITKVEG